jgi:hypothetical protein
VIPARDQVQFKQAKPKPLTSAPSFEHVTIDDQKARMVDPQQAPPIEVEPFVPHAQQVQMRQKFQPKVVKPLELTGVEPDQPLRDIPPVVKEEIPPVTPLASKPQPTKLTPTTKKAPTVSAPLKPVQAEAGRKAVFTLAFTGDEPVTVKWFRDGKELRSTFDSVVRTKPGESSLELNRVKQTQAGEYTVVLENVAGRVESKAALQVQPAPDKGVTPTFQQRIADQRAQQNGDVKFSCTVAGTPRPVIQWFKVLLALTL